MLINKFMPGVGPHWLSDGGGEVGVSTTHENTTGLKKKLKKKKFILGIVYVIYFTYLCTIKLRSKLSH